MVWWRPASIMEDAPMDPALASAALLALTALGEPALAQQVTVIEIYEWKRAMPPPRDFKWYLDEQGSRAGEAWLHHPRYDGEPVIEVNAVMEVPAQIHAVAHEAYHLAASKQGKPNTEQAACQFAADFCRKHDIPPACPQCGGTGVF